MQEVWCLLLGQALPVIWETGIPIATLQCALHHGISARAGYPCVSIQYNWMRSQVWSTISVSVWQHVELPKQICPWDTLCLLLGHRKTRTTTKHDSRGLVTEPSQCWVTVDICWQAPHPSLFPPSPPPPHPPTPSLPPVPTEIWTFFHPVFTVSVTLDLVSFALLLLLNLLQLCSEIPSFIVNGWTSELFFSCHFELCFSSCFEIYI